MFNIFRLARERNALESSHELESTPDLSDSFESVLERIKQKREEAMDRQPSIALNETTFVARDDTMMQCTEESFLANEKMCERTLNLNNVSENFADLTHMGVASPTVSRKPVTKPACFSNETNLESVEAPSFLFNNTSMMLPNHSPLLAVHANRPSTIMEESSSSYKTNMTSYQTAFTRSDTEGSEYKTANDESLTLEEEMIIKMPKLRSFYDTSDITKDSLDVTRTMQNTEMTKDSLNSFSGEASSFIGNSSNAAIAVGPHFNDTLEEIEFMLLQNQKLQEQQRTPQFVPASPATPRVPVVNTSPFLSQLRLKPNFGVKTTTGSASKHSPLIKFSPMASKSPANVPSGFKRPMPSATKLAKPSSSKKFQNIESPVSRYINNTPVVPQAHTPRVLHGIGTSPKNFNFRDSESFAKENESANAGKAFQGSSLPLRAKTKSSSVTQVRLK